MKCIASDTWIKNQSTKLVIELFNHRIKQPKDAASHIGITTDSSW
jgi:hypothetical protein